ncbi:MAG: penicillin-binding protein activator LpoB [Treponema sp.]|nr:penicillin-binding protein activator LpoB [Treponema sp.]
MKRIFIVIGVIFLLFTSCATTSTNVKRVSGGTQGDLSGYWNAIDVEIVCKSLINDCLMSARVEQVIRASGNKKPVVIVGRFRNESSEHIDTAIISSIMENVIFNSGKLDFVAGGGTRDDIREERQEQQSNASEQTAASLGREIGADFMLTGSVRTIVDREGNRSARTYYVTAELTNIETNARMWLGQNNEITKVVVRPNNRL